MTVVDLTREDDVLLLMPEIEALTRTRQGTLRYLRHVGKAPFIWKKAGRLVAWKSEVDAWLKSERAADEEQQSFAGRSSR